MIPWNEDMDFMIDRYDGRALLDFVQKPSKRNPSSEESSEMKRVAFVKMGKSLLRCSWWFLRLIEI